MTFSKLFEVLPVRDEESRELKKVLMGGKSEKVSLHRTQPVELLGMFDKKGDFYGHLTLNYFVHC